MKNPGFFSVLSIAFLLVLVVAGCKKVSSSKDLEEISQMEEKVDENQKLVGMGKAELDVPLLNELGEAYLKFADQYPESSETPEILFRAGEMYGNQLGQTEKAISLYKRIYENYPDHENAATALFLTGYIFHNTLHDLIKAEKAFNQFIEQYPDHKMVKDARFELESLGRPVEEIFEQIMRQNKDSGYSVDSREENPG